MATFNFTQAAGIGISSHIESGGATPATPIALGARPFPEPPASAFHPANLQDVLGMYHRVHVEDGNVIYSRADQIRPPFDQVTQVTEAGDASFPCLARREGELIYLVFQKGEDEDSDVWLTTTFDDGETWSDETLAIPGGTKPIVRVGTDGTILTVALVGENLHATRQDPGDEEPSAVFVVKDETGSPLEVEDDTFDIDQGLSGDAPWILVYVPLGGAAPVEAQSHDELATVKNI